MKSCLAIVLLASMSLAGQPASAQTPPQPAESPPTQLSPNQSQRAQGPHRHHPLADMPLHEKFYSTWYMPDNPAKSCCNKADCYPTEIEYRGSDVYAKRREDGKWLRIPATKIEQRRDNPDGRNHLCAPPPS